MNNTSARTNAQTDLQALQAELAQTNREVLALTLEMDQRVDARTAELRAAQQQLEQANAELRTLTGELERRVAERTEQLSRAHESLKEEARRKDDFLALLGHELRNPLAPIYNAVHLIRKAGQDQSRIEQACAIMQRQVKHMVRLVDDLLEVTRITRNKIELRKSQIDLVDTVRTVVADYQSVLDEHHLIVALDLPAEPLRVEADATRIVQVCGNLIHNAAKFTDPNGTISITVRQDGGWADLSVRDTGVGIAPEKLARIFEPFMQAKETVGRSRSGLGLGLALVKGLVELHGGEVSAHSAGLGQGAEFVVRLPLPAQP